MNIDDCHKWWPVWWYPINSDLASLIGLMWWNKNNNSNSSNNNICCVAVFIKLCRTYLLFSFSAHRSKNPLLHHFQSSDIDRSALSIIDWLQYKLWYSSVVTQNAIYNLNHYLNSSVQKLQYSGVCLKINTVLGFTMCCIYLSTHISCCIFCTHSWWCFK